MFTYKNVNIKWLGHDSFLIQGKGLNIYLDPYEITNTQLPKADIVITSHEHFDHCHPDSINLVSTPDTVLVGPPITYDTLNNQIKQKKEVVSLKPHEKVTVKGLLISAIPAYNTHRFRSLGNPFHPKESGHIGTILHIDDISIYHAGDTDKIPEMENLQSNIALLPVSGTYVMDVAECAEAVKVIKPEIVIPMHVGRGIGSLEDRIKLKNKLPDVRVVVLEMEE
ncbi:MAG: MBL fold metallo-hydrolase [Promethearchaeia archaeon]|nr:MAG: MBL fold metallo-hydrolase [Candidatus Lokiarchaeia archaeon]